MGSPDQVRCHFAVLSTPFGPCGLAWSDRGLVRLQLPAPGAQRLKGATPASPPPWVRRAARKVLSHLSGAPADFSDVPLDLAAVPPFHRRVYQEARRIPAGQAVTYGELARRAGSPRGARAVGQAMAQNPLPLFIPCHRVLASNGLGGFSAPGGLRAKAALLQMEADGYGPMGRSRGGWMGRW